mmetsp:Transcript_8482/g.25469  ORF Transcript_8482/g.25469 Transcript_8482/m.25469 type:complete len:208 (-) Transcript_8482:978-1601(-)
MVQVSNTASLIISIVALLVSCSNVFVKIWQFFLEGQRDKILEGVNAAEAYYDIQGSTADLEDKREKYKPVPLDVKTTIDVKYHSIFGGQQGLDYADVYVLAGLHIISGHDDEFREMREARRKCQKFWDVIAGKYKAKALMHHNGPVELFLRRRLGLQTTPFFGKKWALRGEKHLKLCEPLDIAEWYISAGRPETRQAWHDEEEAIRP